MYIWALNKTTKSEEILYLNFNWKIVVWKLTIFLLQWHCNQLFTELYFFLISLVSILIRLTILYPQLFCSKLWRFIFTVSSVLHLIRPHCAMSLQRLIIRQTNEYKIPWWLLRWLIWIVYRYKWNYSDMEHIQLCWYIHDTNRNVWVR